ncbi:MAG: GNAT family N-acetyltransferase [Alphaproteobacteria bacterium]|nr:GNAT family N-acetyltransferase [Alphaproteobacteria bacterium]MBU1527220.1 GNAT family N-acetyltransferase [Alphaproteobacteria bacterium]MBU2351164.1 GNAT family N-acetyltransferase [Alphaproteobacteria bacterium]MBU2382337.1 GNAT family N-acetyltransferase [Alphaproteobacteria bacterium]
MTPDLDALAALHAEAFDAPWDAAALRSLVDRPGAVLELAPDGFVLVQVAGDEAEVLTLAVRPPARRRGLARALMTRASAEAAARGAGRLFLEVAEDNAAARSLYASLGFGEVGRRPRYYARPGGVGIDALLLALNLTGPLP